MNKKFSTLVAALLASGGLFYAVDAMILPVSDGVAQTYVAASLRAGVAGYEVSTTDVASNAQSWTKDNAKLLIGAGSEWALGANGIIVKAVDGATVTLDTDYSLLLDGAAWTINGEKLYLWASGAMVTDFGGVIGSVTIATSKEVVSDLAAQKQKVVSAEIGKALWTVSADGSGMPENPLVFTVVENALTNPVLSIVKGGVTFYVQGASNGAAISLVTDITNASEVTFNSVSNDALQLAAVQLTVTADANDEIKAAASGTAVLRDGEGNKKTSVAEGDKVYLASTHAGTYAVVTDLKVEMTTLANAAELAEGTGLTSAATLLNTWTLKDGFLSIGDQKLTISGETVSLGGGSVVALNNNGVLTVGGQALYITEGGAFSTTEGKPAALYAVDGSAIAVQPATKLAATGSFVIAEKDVTKKGETYVSLTAKTTVDAGAPGSEYGDVTGISIAESGNLTILTTGVDDIPAAIAIFNENYYLGMKDGKATWIEIPDNKKAWECPQSSWVLDNGKLYNLSVQKSGRSAYFNGVDAGLDSRGVNVSLSIGGQMEAGDYTYNNLSFALGRASLMATNPTPCENPLLSGISSDYILLGGEVDGTMYYIKDVTGALTTDIAEADLWKVEKTLDTNNARYGYKFASRYGASTSITTDNYLTIDGASKFAGWDYVAGLQMVAVDTNNGPIVLDPTASKAKVDNTGAASTILGMYRSSLEQFTAQWLVHRYGSSFELNIVNKYKDIADKTIYGNEFDGTDLVPVVYANSSLVEVAPENSPYANYKNFLLKKQGTELYVVLNVTDRWSNATSDFVDGGFKFELLSAENMKKVLDGNAVNGKRYYPYFRINYLEGKTNYNASNTVSYDKVEDNTPVFCVELGDKDQTFRYDLVNLETKAPNGHLDVFVTVNERCADNDARKPNVTFYTDDENIVRGEDAKNNPLNYRYVNIAFKAGEKMQFEVREGDYVNLNGKVLGIDQDGSTAVPTEKEYFLFDKAEGQWAVVMTEAKDLTKKNKDGKALSDIDSRKFTFINRENPDVKYSVKSMHALDEAKFGKDVYAVEYDQDSYYSPFGYYKTAEGDYINPDLRDTLVITQAKGLMKFEAGKHAKNNDSYAKWTKEELQDKTFQLSIDAAAQLFVVENEGKDSHFLGLSTSEATDWRLVPFTAQRVHDVDAAKYLTAGTDSAYVMAHPQYFKSDGKFYAYDDTTAIVTYALQNIQNGEWLTYDPSQSQTTLSMICDPNSKKFTTDDLGEAYRFVLKEKADGAQKIESGKFNIIGVDAWELGTNSKYVDGKEHYELDYSKKLYGAATYQKQGAVEVEYAYLQPTSNDIFTIASIASAEYVKATPSDTVRIFRAENENDVLFENGQFLNSGNIAQIKDMAPALVLDSAYVEREGNNRYQYLVVVEPDYVPAVYDSKNHLIEPDTMYGRFLVNQIDSAVMVSKNHNNKFINDIEADRKELKLAFQYGFHANDTLYLTDGKGGKVIEEIDLSTADFNKAKFAFKYVNQAANDQFKVQTRWYDYDSAVKAGLDKKDQWNSNNEGYLKVINGVIVVTDSFTNAEEFLMADEASDPTANDAISANGVSVAAIDGAVIVKGAAGKTVVITNILGQTIANVVLSSDNETIAAPAGVVVVAVEGEAAVKAIVK